MTLQWHVRHLADALGDDQTWRKQESQAVRGGASGPRVWGKELQPGQPCPRGQPFPERGREGPVFDLTLSSMLTSSP